MRDNRNYGLKKGGVKVHPMKSSSQTFQIARHENLRMFNPDVRGNAASLPIEDALVTAVIFEAEKLRNLCRASQLVNELGIFFNLGNSLCIHE